MERGQVQRVAVTGGAGQIAYSLLFRIASGELFGPNVPVALHILEVPDAMAALEGVKMELIDSAFPLLTEVNIGSDPMELFKGVHWALLIGSKPRGPGMERKDLLSENGKIFIGQGQALNAVADRNVKVLVVGNPCNTNCWIAMKHAPSLPKTNFHALTRLDQNRAAAQLAAKAHVPVTTVSNMIIWGNHSATQVPDYQHAKIGGKLVSEVIQDSAWLKGPFIETVQKRGAAIIAARGKSSAASAAAAIIDAVKALVNPTPAGEIFSSCICSDGNPYGVPEDLVFSFPCRSKGDGQVEIVKGMNCEAALQERIALTTKELVEEREMVRPLLQGKAKHEEIACRK